MTQARLIAIALALAGEARLVDARGLLGEQTVPGTITVGASGKPIRLICSRATQFVFTGTGHGFVIPEGADLSAIEDLTLDMNQAAGSGFGVHVQGAWYVRLKVNIRNWITGGGGIKASDDGATSRGVYLLDLEDSVAGFTAAAGASDGVLLQSTTAGGVTTVTCRNVDVSTITNGNGYNLQGSGAGLVAAISILGGTAQLCTTGVKMDNGSNTNKVANVVMLGLDVETNSGWGVTNDTTVDGLTMFVSFDANTSGDYQTNAKRILHLGNARQAKFYPNDASTPFLFVGPTPLQLVNNGAAEIRMVSTDAQAAAVGLGAEADGSGYLWSIFDRKNNVRCISELDDGTLFVSKSVTIDGDFSPADTLLNLGDVDNRWQSINAVDGNFSNDLTLDAASVLIWASGPVLYNSAASLKTDGPMLATIFDASTSLNVSGTKVVGAQGGAIADANISDGSGTATSGGYGFASTTQFDDYITAINAALHALETKVNADLAMERTHGLIAT